MTGLSFLREAFFLMNEIRLEIFAFKTTRHCEPRSNLIVFYKLYFSNSHYFTFLFALTQKETKKSRTTRTAPPVCPANARGKSFSYVLVLLTCVGSGVLC